jgi:hypothetical protein
MPLAKPGRIGVHIAGGAALVGITGNPMNSLLVQPVASNHGAVVRRSNRTCIARAIVLGHSTGGTRLEARPNRGAR